MKFVNFFHYTASDVLHSINMNVSEIIMILFAVDYSE